MRTRRVRAGEPQRRNGAGLHRRGRGEAGTEIRQALRRGRAGRSTTTRSRPFARPTRCPARASAMRPAHRTRPARTTARHPSDDAPRTEPAQHDGPDVVRHTGNRHTLPLRRRSQPPTRLSMVHRAVSSASRSPKENRDPTASAQGRSAPQPCGRASRTRLRTRDRDPATPLRWKHDRAVRTRLAPR